MTSAKSPHELPARATRLVNVPLFCWLAALALSGLCYYFEEFGHSIYRDTQEIPNYRAETLVEDYCLWLAALAAAIGIVTSATGLVRIRPSGARVLRSNRLSIGLALNLLTLVAVLFAQFVRELAKAA